MEPIEAGDPGDTFIESLLRASYMLCALAADMADAIPQDAYPGEAPGEVVIEMIAGTIRTYLEDVDQYEVERASNLISGACERVLEHLQLALALSERMHGEADGDERRGFG